MNVDASIFKSYDIRGVYPEQLNPEIGRAVGRSFAAFLNAPKVIVGRDMRLSGPALFTAVTQGLMEQGADVVDIGLVSTDQYYYACATLGLPGMMITASHNPPEYNGFKMVRRMPQLLSGEEGIHDIQRMVQAGQWPKPGRLGSMSTWDIQPGFTDAVLKLIDISAIKPMKIIADTANGMVGPSLKPIFQRLSQIQFSGMYLEPDGHVPHHGLDPLQPANRAELERRVVEEGTDIGFAFDGDGDRFFAIDDRGRFVPGDFMTALLGRYMLQKFPGSKILYDVRASWAVRDMVTAAGGIALMERVGHTYMKRRLAAEGAVFGGEVTGHYYFRDFFGADSGVVPALLVLEVISTSGKKLSELLQPLEEKYFISGEINSKISADSSEKMEEIINAFPDAHVDRLDGVSLTFPTWHCNVRSSNTEPLIRLNVEAMNKKEMEKMRDKILQIIRS